MDANYTWKTKFFSRKFEIFRNDIKCGEISKMAFSRNSTGELNGKQLSFETKKLFKPSTSIINLKDGSVIGSITLFLFKRKSLIKYREKEYTWQFDNFWNTRWSVNSEYGPQVKYHCTGLKGTIDTYTNDEVIILAGFYLRNFFRQRSSATAAT